MRNSLRFGLGALLLSGTLGLTACSQSSQFGGAAVAITVMSDATLAPAIHTLQLSVTGAESDSLIVPADATLATSHQQKIVYRAQGSSGTLMVTVVGQGLGELPIAVGQGSVTLAHGTAALTVTLSAAPPPDLGMASDLGMPDLALPPPMPITPSHVPPSSYQPNAKPLSGVVGIDTTNLTITFGSADAPDGGGYVEGPGYDGGFTASAQDGGAFGSALDGIGFVIDPKSGAAVLSVGSWTVDKEVVVTGSRPLVVVAASDIIVDHVVHLEARGTTAGPGGFGPAAGPGAGGTGITIPGFGANRSGGGGAGGSTPGAPGGMGGSAPRGASGAIQPANMAALAGGSGGGIGAGGFPGGSGGGALQLSAGREVRVTSRGAIDGDGADGIATQPFGPAGSGGGAGGTIFLEAPSITIAGIVHANGGSGGGVLGQNSPGGSASGPPIPGHPGDGFGFGGGGGGGSVGFIWLRTTASGSTSLTGSLSPKPMTDSTL